MVLLNSQRPAATRAMRLRSSAALALSFAALGALGAAAAQGGAGLLGAVRTSRPAPSGVQPLAWWQLPPPQQLATRGARARVAAERCSARLVRAVATAAPRDGSSGAPGRYLFRTCHGEMQVRFLSRGGALRVAAMALAGGDAEADSSDLVFLVALHAPPCDAVMAQGFNNQRQTLELAAALALALGRALLLPTEGSAAHGGAFELAGAYGMRSGAADGWVWLGGAGESLGVAGGGSPPAPISVPARIVNGTCEAALETARAEAGTTFAEVPLPLRSRTAVNFEALQRRYGALDDERGEGPRASQPTVLTLRPTYWWRSFGYRALRSAEDAQCVNEIASAAALATRPADVVLSDVTVAAAALAAMGQPRGESSLDGVLAMHVRLGDRSPHPLVNCTALGGGWRTSSERTRHCEKDGTPLSTAAAVRSTLADDAGGYSLRVSLAYIATNGPSDHTALRELRDALNAANVRAVLWADLVAAAPALRAAEARGGVHVSTVEQELCGLAGAGYVATFPSTWDERVIQIRQWRRMPGADRQAAVLEAKAAAMLRGDCEIGRAQCH